MEEERKAVVFDDGFDELWMWSLSWEMGRGGRVCSEMGIGERGSVGGVIILHKHLLVNRGSREGIHCLRLLSLRRLDSRARTAFEKLSSRSRFDTVATSREQKQGLNEMRKYTLDLLSVRLRSKCETS